MKMPIFMFKKEAVRYMEQDLIKCDAHNRIGNSLFVGDDVLITWTDREGASSLTVCMVHGHQAFDGYNIIERNIGETYKDFLERVLPHATTLCIFILNRDEIKK